MDLVGIEHVRRISEVEAERLPLRHINLIHESPVTYPSVWFTNSQTKPPITIPTPALSLDQLRNALRFHLAANTLTSVMACAYLYSYFEANKSTLTEPWTSFGRLIGAAQVRVGISDIMLVRASDDPVLPQAFTGTSEKDDSWNWNINHTTQRLFHSVRSHIYWQTFRFVHSKNWSLDLGQENGGPNHGHC